MVSYLSMILTRVVHFVLRRWLMRGNSFCVVHVDDPRGHPARSNNIADEGSEKGNLES
jgi:hypothetical protein